MKVIFIEDVPNMADAGEMKEVADGYGRNFLLPRKLAVLADSQASSIVAAQLKKRAHRLAQTEAEMRELAGKLAGVEVTLKAKTGAKDRLYGSITSADIADELNSSAGLIVDKRKIELEEPIRQLGDYELTVRLTKDIIPAIKVKVVDERGREAAKVEETVVELVEEVPEVTEVEAKAEETEVEAKVEEPAEAEEKDAEPGE